MQITNRRPAEGDNLEWAQLRNDNGEFITLLIHERDGGWRVHIGFGIPSTVRVDLDHHSMDWLRRLL